MQVSMISRSIHPAPSLHVCAFSSQKMSTNKLSKHSSFPGWESDQLPTCGLGLYASLRVFKFYEKQILSVIYIYLEISGST